MQWLLIYLFLALVFFLTAHGLWVSDYTDPVGLIGCLVGVMIYILMAIRQAKLIDRGER